MSPVGGSLAIPLISDENCGALRIALGVDGSEPLPPFGSVAGVGTALNSVVGVAPAGV